MTYGDIKNMIAGTQKGSFSSVSWEAPAKVKAAFKGINLVKRGTVTKPRIGVTYDNMKSTIEKRLSGEAPAENAGLTWGQWLEFPYFIGHKGNVYFRFSLCEDSRFSTEYVLNGVVVPKSQVEHMLLKESSGQPSVITVNIENIKSFKAGRA
jgi:hypothetical protein